MPRGRPGKTPVSASDPPTTAAAGLLVHPCESSHLSQEAAKASHKTMAASLRARGTTLVRGRLQGPGPT